MSKARKSHPYYPFDSGYSGGAGNYPMMKITVDDRRDAVSKFTIDECLAALANKNLDLQLTVTNAIYRRIRKLEKVN